MLDPSFSERYSRQIKLPEVGAAGQLKLAESTAVLLGLGGLGSPVAMYLAAAGIGHLIISDFDRVESNNLQRQIVHRETDLGMAKTESAKRTMTEINPKLHVDIYDYQFEEDELVQIASKSQVIIDCTDNFPSRYGINRASQESGIPLVSGAASQWQGQLATFVPQIVTSPCYQCLYPDIGIEAHACHADGILSPIVGVVGSLQALEAIKLLLGVGSNLAGRVMLFDGLSMECQTIDMNKRKDCPACG